MSKVNKILNCATRCVAFSVGILLVFIFYNIFDPVFRIWAIIYGWWNMVWLSRGVLALITFYFTLKIIRMILVTVKELRKND